ncbi:CG34180 [Drosophila busckii]|uniref:CG34180 n=1 Tax=Drosophila busckii TaxID=30019 RepID=A0A0M3QT48_DROBS|nr:CG34180 [Drosophila busckii]
MRRSSRCRGKNWWSTQSVQLSTKL